MSSKERNGNQKTTKTTNTMTRVKHELSVKFYPCDHEKLGATEVRSGVKEFYWRSKRCVEFNYSGLYSIALCETKNEATKLIAEFKKSFGLDWKADRFTITSRTFELF